MNSSLLNDSTVQLETFARDFQRAVDQQIAAFTQERELHKQTMAELNRNRRVLNKTKSGSTQSNHRSIGSKRSNTGRKTT